jgi:hypothetical protein
MAATRQATAESIKACLAQLAQEALEHGFRLCALHLNVAILELDDIIETEELRSRLLAQDNASPHKPAAPL